MLQPELSQSGAVLEAGVSGAPVVDEGLRVHILQRQGVPKALSDQLHIYKTIGEGGICDTQI